MDETWVFSGMKTAYDWQDPSLLANPVVSRRKFFTLGPTPGKERGKRAIVIGIVSKNGVLKESFKFFTSGQRNIGDYHEEMNGAKFENWVKEIIPMMQMEAGNLQPVLILDNAPYHCRIDESTRVPRVKNNSRKGQMIDWLEERGISVPKFALEQF
jgi:hypothetical protein